MTLDCNIGGGDHTASEPLDVVEALCREVQGAIQVLTANRLTEFKAGVAKQEELCARLEAAMQPSTDAGCMQQLSHPRLWTTRA